MRSVAKKENTVDIKRIPNRRFQQWHHPVLFSTRTHRLLAVNQCLTSSNYMIEQYQICASRRQTTPRDRAGSWQPQYSCSIISCWKSIRWLSRLKLQPRQLLYALLRRDTSSEACGRESDQLLLLWMQGMKHPQVPNCEWVNGESCLIECLPTTKAYNSEGYQQRLDD